MTEQTHRFKAVIAGKTYTIVGQTSDEHMRAVTEVLNQQFTQLKQLSPNLSKEDAAILMAFNAISDQLKLAAANDAAATPAATDDTPGTGNNLVLSLIILVVLIFGFRRGYRRGLVLQILNTIGYIVVWVAARFLAKPLATGIGQFIGNLSLNSSASAVTAAQSSSFFLNGLAFSAILTVGFFIVHRIAYGVNKVTWLPVIHQVNSLAGGLINLVIRYVVIFLILNLMILLPVKGFQDSYQASPVAQWIVKQTPVLSKQVYNWWLTEH